MSIDWTRSPANAEEVAERLAWWWRIVGMTPTLTEMDAREIEGVAS